MTVVDDNDKEILQILKVDGRASIRNIAKQLNISPATVSRKIKKMEKQNIIKAYVSIIEDDTALLITQKRIAAHGNNKTRSS